MANLSDKLKQIEQIATKPRMMLDKYLAEGKKVVGCFALYTPEQLVHAAGIIPMGLWGGKVEPYLAKQYNPAITCPIMMTTFEFGLNGSYKGLSAVLIPCSLCDILRCVSQNWKSGVDIPMIPFTLPQNRDIEASVDFLVSEYELVKERLENISGNKITDEALKNSIDIYNKHNATMREFAEVANLHLDIITPSVRHNIMKSAMFVEKQAHTKMVREIIDELNAIPVHEWKGKRVILTGILAEPNEFLNIFEQNNIAVVGDDLGQELRQYRTDIPICDNPVEGLARQWKNREGCSLTHTKNKDRGTFLMNLVKKGNADGVVVCMMKFCDPEEYDYPIYNKKLKEAGIPTLHVDIDQQTQNSEQSRTRIQTFAEMI